MRRRSLLAVVTVCALPLAALPLGGATAVAAGCGPLVAPQLQGRVPTPRQVLGIDLGDRDVTGPESDRYLAAVDAASDRVTTGTLATSVLGRPLRYAVVATPARLARLGDIGADIRRLRDPALPAAEAAAITARAPDVLWVAGNVHGDEESGTDAALGSLQRLVDSTDCAARRVLDQSVVVFLPMQNPDGRAADTRTNAYGFDLNRDWFARTQVETDGKLELLRQLPPQLYVDDHEQGGGGFFFPPNADPIYHEVPRTAVDWIDHRYAPALGAAFEARGYSYFTRDVYDLFYMGYGDTVPATGFTAAGMTFEVSAGYTAAKRFRQQSLAQWTALFQGADGRAEILSAYHRSHVQAAAQGAAGTLQANKVYNPGNDIQRQVPDRSVREYFVRTDDPAKQREVATLVRRLQRMDVEVRSLTAPLTVPWLKPYGDEGNGPVTLPAGTLYVSMAQGQKHWAQAMLNEDTYVPFPYFYDVTAWSSPLLLDLDGGSSGAVVRPASRVLPPVAAPAAAAPQRRQRIAVLADPAAGSSSGWLRWRLEQDWQLPYVTVTPQQVATGALGRADVLVVADQDDAAVRTALGPGGRAALRSWVQAGGSYVGWQGGTRLAVSLGLSSATLTAPTSDVPGSLFEVTTDPASVIASGLGPDAWAYYAYDDVMRSDHAVLTYPRGGAVSGFAQGAGELAGTAAAADEPRGAGRVTVFSVEPNFRGFTDGTARMVWNALAGAAPAAASAPAPDGVALPEVALALPTERAPLRVTVPASAAAATAAVLARHGAAVRVERVDDRVRFVVAGGAPVDAHPWARELPAELAAAGVTPVAVTVPSG